MSVVNAYSNLIGLYVPRQKSGTVPVGGSNPTEVEVVLEDRGRPVFLGKINITLPTGASLSSFVVFFDFLQTNSVQPFLRVYEHDILPVVQDSGGSYEVSSEDFTSGGNIEPSITGFKLSVNAPVPGNLIYKATFAVPLSYYMP